MATSTEEWIDELKGISVLELSERIKALEEAFGVSATAVAAAAPSPPAAGAAATGTAAETPNSSWSAFTRSASSRTVMDLTPSINSSLVNAILFPSFPKRVYYEPACACFWSTTACSVNTKFDRIPFRVPTKPVMGDWNEPSICAISTSRGGTLESAFTWSGV